MLYLSNVLTFSFYFVIQTHSLVFVSPLTHPKLQTNCQCQFDSGAMNPDCRERHNGVHEAFRLPRRVGSLGNVHRSGEMSLASKFIDNTPTGESLSQVLLLGKNRRNSKRLPRCIRI